MRTIRLFSILLAVGMLFSILPACKKGANDPFITMKSRDGRIIGVWLLKSADIVDTDISTVGGTQTTDVTTESYNGTLWTIVSGGTTTSTSYTEQFTVNKEGTVDMVVTDDGDSWTVSGDWFWVDNNKSKIGVSLLGTGYILDKLSSKEMVVTDNYSSSYTDSDNNGFSSTKTETRTYEKQ